MSESSRETALEVVDLHKSFGRVEVLKGVHLEALERDVIPMLGASGSGKSRFLRCINLLETPNSGTVSAHGETIRLHNNKYGEWVPEDMKQVIRLRARLGMVIQSFNLPVGSPAASLSPKPDTSDRRGKHTRAHARLLIRISGGAVGVRCRGFRPDAGRWPGRVRRH